MRYHLLFAVCLVGSASQSGLARQTIYQSTAFTVTDTSVQQGRFRAVARSRHHLESNYQRAAAEVNFKFSINGLENDHPPGSDYMIYLRPRDGRIITPVYQFGVLEAVNTPIPEIASASTGGAGADVTFRLDMRAPLQAWRDSGWYKPPNGPPIKREDFKGVYIIGNTEPLSWDFGRLVPGAPVQLHDPDGDGIFTVTLRFATHFARPLDDRGYAFWRPDRDVSELPSIRSAQLLIDALHNLALDELRELERDDGTMNAGGRWPGVWTRDLAWSTLLGVIFTHPERVRRGLLARVDSQGRIIQDSGTGGSWPLSTDRVAWSLAAWEYFALTGDTTWLRQAYEIIRRSAEADLKVVFDTTTGLFRGESTFLDWRDQSYPRWMDAKDIGNTPALGTNALHFASYRVLGRMARLLGRPAARWDSIAGVVQRGVDQHLWVSDRGHYGQFRYGRVAQQLSPRFEALGNALTVTTGLVNNTRAVSIVARAPVVPFGVPSFWPYLPDVPPYHNAGVWPQVIGFYGWAAATAGNTSAVEHALASLVRASALFLTNKENWVAATGHFEGTEVNSDRFMASAAAQLAINYRILFGLRLESDRLILKPVVPRAYAGRRVLSNLRYRNARLTIAVNGFGRGIREVRLDGSRVQRAEIPATLSGAHTLEITLDGVVPAGAINRVDHHSTPATPSVTLRAGELSWPAVPGGVSYRIFRNGVFLGETQSTSARTRDETAMAEYQVAAVDQHGRHSFLSEPVRVLPENAQQIVPFTGTQRTPADSTVSLRMTVSVPQDGDYAIDFSYANGNGAVSYGDRASVRLLLVDGHQRGTVLLPQRGINRWDDWGYSNAVIVRLARGAHTIELGYRAANANMNGQTDEALIDHVRVARLAVTP